MGFFDDITGKTASNAANAAASDTYDKQRQAIAQLMGYGDQYANEFKNLSSKFDPYTQGGTQAQSQLMALLGLGGDQQGALGAYRAANPGLQEGLQSGSEAITGNAAARGMLNSGSTLKGLDRFGQDYSNKYFGDYLNRLGGVANTGLTATGSQVNTVGTGLQGQLGTRTSAYGGQMQSAPTIGQGQIAGANATAQGSQNLLNTGLKLGGMAMGGGGLSGLLGGFGGGGGGQTWADNSSPYFMQGGNSYPMFR